jgi:hypothetical protein
MQALICKCLVLKRKSAMLINVHAYISALFPKMLEHFMYLGFECQ